VRMRTDHRATGPWEPIVLLVLILEACDTSAVPRPRFPQVEQATEAVEGGGERYRAHRTCSSAAKSVDDLIGCMREAGWDFVTRGPAYPESGCWQARDRGEVNHILPICFVHGSAPSTGGTR
jgi:hypothetical protein